MPGKRERIVALIVNQNEYDVGTVIGTLSKGASRNSAEDSNQQRQNATAQGSFRQSRIHVRRPEAGD